MIAASSKKKKMYDVFMKSILVLCMCMYNDISVYRLYNEIALGAYNERV